MADHETPTFSDPEFVTHLNEYGGSFSTQQTADHIERERLAKEAERQGSLNRLGVIAEEVARAAKGKVEAEPIYELREKGAVRKFINNRGKEDLVEATEGWVIVPPSSDVVKKSPGKANLTNGSGLGLVLTVDGKLYGSISRKPLKPFAERLTDIERADIERRTFMPKEKAAWYHPPVGKDKQDNDRLLGTKTFYPRYRALGEGVPTLIGNLSDSEGGLNNPYFTPYVIGQCYDALAKFVQENDLSDRGGRADTEEDATEETIVRKPQNEPPTEPLEENISEENDKPAKLEKVESLSDLEKIDQWFDEGLVTLQSWLGENDLDQKHNPGHRRNQYMTVYNDRARASKLLEIIKKARTPETIRKALSNQGIGELVTAMDTGKRFAEIDPDSPKAAEPLTLLTYEVPYSGKAPSAETVMNLFLPQSEVEKAIRMVSENPALMQETAERFMDDYLKVGESWDEHRPDYEKLRARNEGRGRLAFRTNFHAKPAESNVREF